MSGWIGWFLLAILIRARRGMAGHLEFWIFSFGLCLAGTSRAYSIGAKKSWRRRGTLYRKEHKKCRNIAFTFEILSGEEQAIGLYIIGNLEENGYLALRVEDILHGHAS
jgi:hypothetical protein